MASVPNSSGTGSTSMGYDDQGNDLRTAVGGDTEVNGPLGVTATTDGSGHTTYYTRTPDGQLVDSRGSSATYYYVHDNLGSTVVLLDGSDTNAAGTYSYDPYGNITNSLTSAAAGNPFRYTGGYQDIEGDNLYHFGARYYDPTLGRFSQPDSVIGNIVNPNTIDLYTYAGGDPINDLDPTGRSWYGDAEDFISSAGSEIANVAQTTGCVLGQFNPLGAESNGSLVLSGVQAVAAGAATIGGAFALGGPAGAGVASILGVPEIAAGGYLAYQGVRNIASACG